MRAILLIFGLLSVLSPSVVYSAEKVVFGYLEDVVVFPSALPMKAKLDTGADHSSINAEILKEETKGGKNWVTFAITSKSGTRAVIEKEVIREAKIRRHSGNTQVRQVVMMEICLGNIRRSVQVNLVKRTKFNYKILIGRSYLVDHAIVDPGLKYTAEPNCR